MSKMTTAARSSLALLCALTLLGVSVQAKTVTWDNSGGTGEWNTTVDNWVGTTLYVDGDDVEIKRGSSPNGSTIFIGQGGVPGSVSPKTIKASGGYGETWTLTGGDIAGTGTVNMNQDNTLIFTQDSSLSFSGGAYINANGNFRYRPTTAGTYSFGSGGIFITAGGGFYFEPSNAATLTNPITIQSGGGALGGNANATYSSTVTLNGALTAGGRNIYSAATFNLTDDRKINLPISHNSSAWAIFNGTVDGGGTRSLTIQAGALGGGWSDYYAQINHAGGWDIKDFHKVGGQHLIIPNTATFFSGVDGNGGVVYVDEGKLVPGTGNHHNNKSGTYDITADYVIASPARVQASVVNVTSGGTVGGTGTIYANNTYVGTSGTAGTLAPGNSIGTLNVNGNLTLGSNSLYALEVDPLSSNSDLIAVVGDLTLGGTLNVSGYDMDVWGDAYQIMTYTGSFSGAFDSVTGLPSYLNADIVAADGIVSFSAIPEPATTLLIGLALAAGLIRRPRRGVRSAGRAQLGLAFALVLSLGMAGTVQAASLTYWAGGTDVWDTTSPNWDGGSATFSDGDTANFSNHSQGSAQTVTIDGTMRPASVYMHYWGGTNGAYAFSGGDIADWTSPTSVTLNWDGVLYASQSYTFTGGFYINHDGANFQLKPTTAGTYHFGSDGSGNGGVVTLNNRAGNTSWGQFRFLPTVAATCDNDFVIGPNGGTILGNANALWDSTVVLNGTGRVSGASAAASWAGLTFDLNGADRKITMFRGGSGDEREFDATVDGGGIYNVTFGDGSTSGGTTDYEIVIGSGSSWNVNNLIIDSPQTAVMVKGTDSQTVFDGVQGKIILQEGILATTQGSAGNMNYGGTYYVENDYEIHDDPDTAKHTRIIASTIYVQDGGRVSGDGILHAHGVSGVIVNDGTLAPGFSVGTLDVIGDLTLNSNAVYDWEVDANSNLSDVLAVDGDITMGGTLSVSGYDSTVWGDEFQLMTYTGIADGTFASVTGLPSYLNAEIIAADGIVTFSAIPEPATAGLLCLLTSAMFLRRRR